MDYFYCNLLLLLDLILVVIYSFYSFQIVAPSYSCRYKEKFKKREQSNRIFRIFFFFVSGCLVFFFVVVFVCLFCFVFYAPFTDIT